jgi:Protein of unknown function (DUF3467)
MIHDKSSGLGACQEAQQIEGRYANHFSVGHNAFEFVLDFGQFYPDGGRARVHTRIIISPSYAKAFDETLRGSIEQYEDTFGKVAGARLGSGPGGRGENGDDPAL